METLKDEKLKSLFIEMDTSLANIEVKGDSVRHLMNVRNIISHLFSKINEEEKKDDSG